MRKPSAAEINNCAARRSAGSKPPFACAETLIRQTYAQMHGQNQHILSPVSKTEALDPPMTSAQCALLSATFACVILVCELLWSPRVFTACIPAALQAMLSTMETLPCSCS